jgi:hypothetical protein
MCGGKQFVHPMYPKGQFYAPTVLADVTADMLIATEEIFGPVITIYKFQREEEALKIANGTEFGLGSSVFSRDYVKAERVAKKLRVGMANVNGWGVNYLCQVIIYSVITSKSKSRFRLAVLDCLDSTDLPGSRDYVEIAILEQPQLIDSLYWGFARLFRPC